MRLERGGGARVAAGMAVLVLVCDLVLGCVRATASAPTPAGDLAAQLMAADRAFAAATAARGLDGWMEYIAPDAVRLGRMQDPVRGFAAIRVSDAAIFADPALRLTWDPTDAGAFDGTHGWTVGRSQTHRRAADGSDQVVRTGRYVTIWRRAGDGRWLVVLDTGASDPAPPPDCK